MLNAKKGRLLISEPALTDPVFFKSVVLLTHHSDEESIVLVLSIIQYICKTFVNIHFEI